MATKKKTISHKHLLAQRQGVLVLGGLLLVSVLGCRPSRKLYEAHNRRVDEINERYDAALRESAQKWQDLNAEVGKRRSLLVPVREGARYQPVNLVASQFDAQLAACSDQPPPNDESCFAEVRTAFAKELTRVYFAADFDWCLMPMGYLSTSLRDPGW